MQVHMWMENVVGISLRGIGKIVSILSMNGILGVNGLLVRDLVSKRGRERIKQEK